MHVLICLESPHAASAVADYLAAHGVEAECSANAELAVHLLRFRRHDALLCDAAISGRIAEDGLALARSAKKIDRRIRTIVLATSPFAAAQHSVDRGDIDVLLFKPMPLMEVLRSVRESLPPSMASPDPRGELLSFARRHARS